MFFNKLLPAVILPLGLMFILLICALRKMRRRWPLLAAIAILYISSVNYVGDKLIGLLERRYPALPPATVPKSDAIVVLGGFLGPPAKPGCLPNFGDASERLDAGVALLREGAAPILVFTAGGKPPEDALRNDEDPIVQIAVDRGVARSSIIVTRRATNTADEAAAISELALKMGFRRIILVTTAWHMPRAYYIFSKTKLECTPFPVDFHYNEQRDVTYQDFIPNASALALTEITMRELYGNAFYHAFR